MGGRRRRPGGRVGGAEGGLTAPADLLHALEVVEVQVIEDLEGHIVRERANDVHRAPDRSCPIALSAAGQPG